MITIKYKRNEVHCYGQVCEDSNISVEATDEAESGLVDMGGFCCWKEAVHYLVDCGKFPSGVEQLEVI